VDVSIPYSESTLWVTKLDPRFITSDDSVCDGIMFITTGMSKCVYVTMSGSFGTHLAQTL
jgi:hypothetical protein